MLYEERQIPVNCKISVPDWPGYFHPRQAKPSIIPIFWDFWHKRWWCPAVSSTKKQVTALDTEIVHVHIKEHTWLVQAIPSLQGWVFDQPSHFGHSPGCPCFPICNLEKSKNLWDYHANIRLNPCFKFSFFCKDFYWRQEEGLNLLWLDAKCIGTTFISIWCLSKEILSYTLSFNNPSIYPPTISTAKGLFWTFLGPWKRLKWKFP